MIPVEWRIYFLKSEDFRAKIPLHFFVRDPSEMVKLYLLQRALEAEFKKSGSTPFPVESVAALLRDASRSLQIAFASAVAERWIVVQADSSGFLEATARHLDSLGLTGMREHLSRWESLPKGLIVEFSENAEPAILANLAALPKCPKVLHERLAHHDVAEVRAAVARFTTSSDLQEILASDPSQYVRAGLAASHHISANMQLRLLRPRNAEIHLSLMKNPSVTPEVLTVLARLPHTGIAQQLLTHSKLPQAVFDELIAESSHNRISHETICANPRLLTPRNFWLHKTSFHSCVLIAYANNAGTPVDILADLACMGTPR
jgi:hypothetical protein